MKKTNIKAGLLLLSATALAITFVMCKKNLKQESEITEVKQNVPSNSIAAKNGIKLTVSQADSIGILHNIAVDELMKTPGSRIETMPSDSIDLHIGNYLNSNGFSVPQDDVDYESVKNDSLFGNMLSETIINNYWNQNKISLTVKNYMLDALQKIEQAKTIEEAHSNDASFDIGPIIYNSLDSLEVEISNNTSLTESENDKLLGTISVIKYSSQYWNNLGRMQAKGLACPSSACKVCISNNKWGIIAMDGLGAWKAFSSGKPWWWIILQAAFSSISAVLTIFCKGTCPGC